MATFEKPKVAGKAAMSPKELNRETCNHDDILRQTDTRINHLLILYTRLWRDFIVHINYINNAGCSRSRAKGIIRGSEAGLGLAANPAHLVPDELEVVHAGPVDESPVEDQLQRRAEHNVVIRNSLRRRKGGQIHKRTLTLEAGRVGGHGEEVAEIEVTVVTQEIAVISEIEESATVDGTEVQNVATGGGMTANGSRGPWAGTVNVKSSLEHTYTTVTTYLGELISYWPVFSLISNQISQPVLAAGTKHGTTGSGLRTMWGEDLLHKQSGGVASPTLSGQISKDCMIKPVQIASQDTTKERNKTKSTWDNIY